MDRSSALRKLGRGIKHVKMLRGEALAFENARAYVLRTEHEQRAVEKIEYRCFAVERDKPSSDWPLIAGDAIQNLRSSLDHAVYQASGRKRGTQYPIFWDRCEFQVKGRPMMKDVPAPVRALIEHAQPFNTITAQPKADPLFILNWLSNLDKHRNLATVAAAVGMPGVAHDGLDINFIDTGEGRPLNEGTKIMAFVVSGVSEPDQVKVYPDFAYEVAIEGRPLVSTLEWIVREVFLRLIECESGQAPPLLTPDPFALF